MSAQLTSAWRDLAGLQLTLGEIDVEGDGGVTAPLGEPTFAVTLEARVDSLPSTMSLLIPWSAVAPVADEILRAGSRAEEASPHEGRAVNRGLASAHVRLRAEVGATLMPVEQMLALAPGALLVLDDRAEDGLQVFAERVPLGRASPGLRGARRAVKLTTTLEPGCTAAMPAASASVSARALARPVLLEPLNPESNGNGPIAGDDGSASTLSSAHGSLARMMGVPVRVWAEFGRTALPLGSALELPPGTVLELEQGAEAPIELFANGKCFAHGGLQVDAEGMWAVQIDALT
jgi:flagellar motor switch/type III secretory pathway protein FliN